MVWTVRQPLRMPVGWPGYKRTLVDISSLSLRRRIGGHLSSLRPMSTVAGAVMTDTPVQTLTTARHRLVRRAGRSQVPGGVGSSPRRTRVVFRGILSERGRPVTATRAKYRVIGWSGPSTRGNAARCPRPARGPAPPHPAGPGQRSDRSRRSGCRDGRGRESRASGRAAVRRRLGCWRCLLWIAGSGRLSGAADLPLVIAVVGVAPLPC